MVEWLAGNRITGTSTERTTTTGFNPVDAVAGGWKELGRTTLGSDTALDLSSIADKRYYMVLTNCLDSAPSGDYRQRFNADSGLNYSDRGAQNGTVFTEINKNVMFMGGLSPTNLLSVQYISNLSSKEKLSMNWAVDEATAGAGTAPDRFENVHKWTNTASVINRIQSSGNYNTGSELVVLGWDPADEHTTNFWEELASVELGSAGDNLSSGTITAKKYLWVQAYCIASGAIDMKLTWNNVSTSTYAQRRSINGGADATATSQANVYTAPDNTNYFLNMFFVNDGSNEPLGMIHAVHQNTAGAATAPQRSETVCKNSNTTQITEIDIDNSAAGSFDTGSIIKVYGSD